jgi:hypothetical protein
MDADAALAHVGELAAGRRRGGVCVPCDARRVGVSRLRNYGTPHIYESAAWIPATAFKRPARGGSRARELARPSARLAGIQAHAGVGRTYADTHVPGASHQRFMRCKSQRVPTSRGPSPATTISPSIGTVGGPVLRPAPKHPKDQPRFQAVLRWLTSQLHLHTLPEPIPVTARKPKN